ncbi:DUF2690 domain-containing protein [Streptomyces sp. NPDC087300]|uniref:helix-turn-helix domain-containing protein n=1 Tax=Streptomyces sp. NPDC087300 TaxID=3365780 RepID=UPI00381BB770
MPRWKALPDELDPQVREFASQLRRLVDRSGLSIAAVSDRTGYSKTSWERYLNGRLLAPKGAIVALAEVTGTQPVHLITMWELAERAWSRSEMRHDMTMQAIRISQARAALGELGPNPTGSSSASGGAGGGAGKAAKSPKGKGDGAAPRNGVGGIGIAGPAGVSPTVPPQRPASSPSAAPSASPSSPPSSPSASSPSPSPSAPGTFGAPSSSYEDVSASAFGAGGAGGAGAPPSPTPPAPPASSSSPDGQRRRRKLTMFLAGTVGALVVIAAAVLLTRGGDDKNDEAKPSATPSSSGADLPAGVECSGTDCAGKDPENMGCGGELAKTTSRATIGTKTVIEVRYSKVCGAAWARITQAAPGDEVEITGGGGGTGAKQTGTVDKDFDAYTPMVAAKSGTAAKACATLKSGQTGCTE